MSTLIWRVMAVAGCVVLAGVSVAETSQVQGQEEEKSDDTEVTLQVQPPSESPKLGKWPMERHANPNVGKEETKELLRGRRPK